MSRSSIEQLTAEIQQNPSNVEAFYQRGILLAGNYIANHERADDEDAPDYRQAIQDFEKVIELTPDDSAAYYHKACIYFALDLDDDEAESLLRSALALDKENTDYLKKFAEVITYHGENAHLAAAIMKKVIESEPAPGNYFSLGNYLKSCAEYDEMLCDLDAARSNYQEAIDSYEKSGLLADSDKNSLVEERIQDCQAGIARL